MGFGLFLFLVVVGMEMAPYVFDNSSGAGGAGGAGQGVLRKGWQHRAVGAVGTPPPASAPCFLGPPHGQPNALGLLAPRPPASPWCPDGWLGPWVLPQVPHVAHITESPARALARAAAVSRQLPLLKGWRRLALGTRFYKARGASALAP